MFSEDLLFQGRSFGHEENLSFIPKPRSGNDLGVAYKQIGGFPGGSDSKNPPTMWETWFQSLGWEDPLDRT